MEDETVDYPNISVVLTLLISL